MKITFILLLIIYVNQVYKLNILILLTTLYSDSNLCYTLRNSAVWFNLQLFSLEFSVRSTLLYFHWVSSTLLVKDTIIYCAAFTLTDYNYDIVSIISILWTGCF